VTTKVSIDGLIQDEASAVIPVTDRGFLYGDSVYEVVRTYGGKPFALAEHLERLQQSAAHLAMPLSASGSQAGADSERSADGLEPIVRDIHATLAAADHPESYVRVIITRGSGPMGLDPGLADHPRRVVIVAPLQPLPELWYDDGVPLHLVATGRAGGHTLLAGAKSGNYLVNVLALGVAREQGAHEAILLDHDDRVTEGASSNLFVVQDGQLLTPPVSAGILEGITRHKVCALAAQAGFPVTERPIHRRELRQADEIFLTSTLREILPVQRVDQQPVGDGRPGPITKRLLAAYRDAARVQHEPR
jgi:branched-chain amino acid aminotransferase